MIDTDAHVIELVRDTVRKYASTEIPDFDEICSSLGLVVKEVPLSPERDGMITDGTILINSRIQSKERKQFTRFHEVMHHLIDEDEELISMLHEATWGQNGEYERQVERLCNIGAAEFLMPREEFTELYKEKGFNVELIPSAANLFGSSAIATTIQLAQVAPNSCITAICEYGLIPNESAPAQGHLFDKADPTLKPKLHVVYSALSPAMKYWLARDTKIPDDHLIHQAFLEARPLEGESYVPFRSGNQMPCYCEALPDKDRVYVLFHLTPRPNPNPDQLTFI
jgi:Zn-dependent peptidase ImmA (M78 family)